MKVLNTPVLQSVAERRLLLCDVPTASSKGLTCAARNILSLRCGASHDLQEVDFDSRSHVASCS